MKTDLDFLEIVERTIRKGCIEVIPSFITYIDEGEPVTDIMVRSGDFYAVFNEKTGFWSPKETYLNYMVDKRLWEYYKKRKDETTDTLIIRTMKDAKSGSIDDFHKYVNKQLRDNSVPLDKHILFANDKPKKEDYATQKLDYVVKEGPCPNWEKLLNKLYSPEEAHKIEWFGGAVMSEASQNPDFQKCLVFHGDSGSGKSTIIHVFEQALGYKDSTHKGYTETFRSKALGGNEPFATSDFASDPILAIEHDGDLSHIEDNTRLNSIISHEPIVINGKHKAPYSASLRTAIIMGTNKPVKITDQKSGMIRRVIDVTPTGKTFPTTTYFKLKKDVKTEIGAIVARWIKVYEANPRYYDKYIPTKMLKETNEFYNFILDKYDIFARDNAVTLKSAWEMYKKYCEEAKVPYPFTRRVFETELQGYFTNYEERHRLENGSYVRSYFSGFKLLESTTEQEEPKQSNWLVLKEYTSSIFDKAYADCPAQDAKLKDGRYIPKDYWVNCKTKLRDISTYKTHFVKLPDPTHIVMDFDYKDENGEKDLNRNIEEASKWPPTYSEVSQSGGGLHLHYIYDGDPLELENRINDSIEVKVYTGDAPLRRRLTLCNDLPIAHISSGLPLKKESKKVYDSKVLADEKKLKAMIYKAIERDENGKVVNYHGHTASNVSLIKKWLDDAYFGEGSYDVSITEPAIIEFGDHATNQARECSKMIRQMHFKSKDIEEKEREHIPPTTPIDGEDNRPMAIYDLETSPNHRLVCYYDLTDFYRYYDICKAKDPDIKIYDCWCNYVKTHEDKGDDISKYVKYVLDYSPEEAEWIIENYRLIGHNCHNYDNDIFGGVAIDRDSIEASYERSKNIINTKGYRGNYNFFGISYADTYEFPAATNRKSLKWWEIFLGINHKEFNWPWDKDIPDEKINEWISYCKNDVVATVYLWFHLQPDFRAQKMLVKLVKTLHPECTASVNDRTNSLSQKMMFGNERNPQKYFVYRNLGEKTENANWCYKDYLAGKPWATVKSGKMPYFPGYKCVEDEKGKLKSTYRQWDGHIDDDKFEWVIGEGGLVLAKTGMHYNVKAADIQSAHPHSAIIEGLYGQYTAVLSDLVETRVDIKHKDFESAKKRFNGALKDILGDPSEAKDISNALKTVINSLYGESKSQFDNRFRDPRNYDNIIAKRVALFMVDLYNMVIDKGYKAIHIKTDSIKVEEADDYIIGEIKRMGEAYGYSLDIESHYERMCLINKAEYIAYGADDDPDSPNAWYPKGDTFKTPYIFKTLFTHEPITFKDLGETKSVTGASMYLDMNEGYPDVTLAERELEKRIANQKIIDLNLTKKPVKLNPDFADLSDEDLKKYISEGHNYQFAGRVDRFSPILAGKGGGILLSYRNDKYSAVNGTKGYRWLESETIRGTSKEHDIDMSYFETLANDAKAQIEKFGSFEEFVSLNPPQKWWEDINTDKLPF